MKRKTSNQFHMNLFIVHGHWCLISKFVYIYLPNVLQTLARGNSYVTHYIYCSHTLMNNNKQENKSLMSILLHTWPWRSPGEFFILPRVLGFFAVIQNLVVFCMLRFNFILILAGSLVKKANKWDGSQNRGYVLQQM